MKPIKRIIYLFLVIIILVQAALLAREYLPAANRIRKNYSKTAMWRSAYFTSSNQMADYLEWIDNNTPEDIKILIPPDGYSSIPSTPYLQFYLSPRYIANCTEDYSACAGDMLSSSYYILIMKPFDFPGEMAEELADRSLMMNDSRGILFPEGVTLPEQTAPVEYTGFVEFGLSFLPPLLFLLLVSIPFAFLYQSAFKSLSPLSSLSFGFISGTGALTFPILALLLFDISLMPVHVLASAALLWVLAGIVYLRKKSDLKTDFLADLKSDWGWYLIFVALGAGGLLISVGKGYSSTDALVLWGPKAYGILSQGIQEGASWWGTLTTYYPLNLPLMIGYMKTLFAETIPQSKMLFPLFYLSGLVLFFDFLKKQTSSAWAGLFTLVLGTSALVFDHSVIAYANLPTTIYIFAFMLLANEGFLESKPSTSTSVLAGLLLILAAWTRPEVLPIAWVMLLLIGVFTWLKHHKLNRLNILLPILLLGAYSILWAVLQNYVYIAEPFSSSLIGNGLKELFSGNINFPAIIYILQYFISNLFDIQVYGFIGWLTTALFVWMLLKRTGKADQYLPAATGALYILIILGSYYFTSYKTNTNHDLSWWVQSGLMRMILPGLFLFFLNLVQKINGALQHSSEDQEIN